MNKNQERFNRLREQYRKEGRLKARDNPEDYMYGCILYWTEGYKNKFTVDFTNSDVFMVKYFVDFLRKHFNCTDEDFTISINAYLNNGLTMGDIELYWMNSLGLPSSCLRKFTNRAKYYDPENKRKKTNRPYGICKLRVHNSKIIETIYGSIEEKFGVIIELKKG